MISTPDSQKFLHTVKHPGEKLRRKPGLSLSHQRAIKTKPTTHWRNPSLSDLMPRTQPTPPHPVPGSEKCYLPTPSQLLEWKTIFKFSRLKEAWCAETQEQWGTTERRWKLRRPGWRAQALKTPDNYTGIPRGLHSGCRPKGVTPRFCQELMELDSTTDGLKAARSYQDSQEARAGALWRRGAWTGEPDTVIPCPSETLVHVHTAQGWTTGPSYTQQPQGARAKESLQHQPQYQRPRL